MSCGKHIAAHSRACWSGTIQTHSQSTRTRIAASSSTKRTRSTALHIIPAIAEPRHPGTADAAHTHARAGLRERNGPKPTRRARATRPATSQHRVGRRRRGSDERRRTLLFARALFAFSDSWQKKGKSSSQGGHPDGQVTQSDLETSRAWRAVAAWHRDGNVAARTTRFCTRA